MSRVRGMRWVPVALVCSVLGVQAVALRAAPVPREVAERPAKDVLKIGFASEIVERPGGFFVFVEVEYETTGARVISCPVYDENAGEFVPGMCGDLAAYEVKAGRGKLAFGLFVPRGSKWGASIADGSFPQAWVAPEMRLPSGELKAEAAEFLNYSADGQP